MAITFTGAGGLFTKIGHILGIIRDVNAFSGFAASPAFVTPPDTTPTIATKVNTLIADFAGSVADKAVTDGLIAVRNNWQSSQSSFLSTLQTLAQNAVIEAVAVDGVANSAMTVPNSSITTALTLVVEQMKGNLGGTQSHVSPSSLAAGTQTNVGSPTGAYAATGNSGPVIVSALKDGHGLGLDYALTDTVTFLTTADSYTGGKTKWQETVTAAGVPAISGSAKLGYLWPNGGGSGASKSFTIVDANQSNQGGFGNLLQSSEFTTATTTDYPDNWTYLVGVATTNFKQHTGAYRSDLSKSLEFVGDGATLNSVVQTFNTAASTTAGSGGSPFNLASLPATNLAVNFWYSLSGASPATGVLKVDLVDGSNTIINDDLGTANTITVTLTTIADTIWHNVSGSFRLPTAAPSTVKIRFRTSTAIENGKSLYLSHVALVKMTQLATGAPFVAIFGGNLAPVTNDAWTLAYTQTFGAFQLGWEQLFNMASLGLRLPTTGGSAINDNLVA